MFEGVSALKKTRNRTSDDANRTCFQSFAFKQKDADLRWSESNGRYGAATLPHDDVDGNDTAGGRRRLHDATHAAGYWQMRTTNAVD